MRFDGLTPRVPRIYLLLIAALVWTFAGGMLLFRGYFFLIESNHLLLLKIVSCVSGGLVFYALLFDKISKKHITRIKGLAVDRPCAFSFFNWRSYMLMAVMITSGIALRKSGFVAPEYLSFIYITMGVPLLMSSFRFYYSYFNR
jgi:hypothetical protein